MKDDDDGSLSREREKEERLRFLRKRRDLIGDP
jgi:hypothetical protein